MPAELRGPEERARSAGPAEKRQLSARVQRLRRHWLASLALALAFELSEAGAVVGFGRIRWF